MALTDTAIKNAKPAEKPRRLSDEKGLYLEISPRGGKWWRLKYRFANKERRLSLGTYPEVSLAEARERRDAARKLVAAGVDPSQERKREKAAQAERASNTLESVAKEWLAAQGWASNYREKVEGRLKRWIFPLLGDRPLRDITAPELLTALRRIEAAGNVETARRAKQHVSRAYRFAMAAGKADANPAAGLEEALQAKPKATHFAAVTDPDRLGELLRAIDGFQGTPAVTAALRLAPLLLVRPGELRRAEWDEIDLDGALWAIPAEKMKMRQAHLVPLPTQAVAMLRHLQPWTSRSRYVFPGGRSAHRPMSENALNAALRRVGYAKGEVTVHGFRATARTLLDEVLGFRPDYIEHQLAHQVRDANGRAYNRTTFLEQRRVMLQRWAGYLDELRAGEAKVVPLRHPAT